MKLGRWSTTAASNNSTAPDGAPDGQPASTFNDCMKENMAAIRTVFNDAEFFDQALTPTYVSASAFSFAGDQTSAIHAGRRLKIFDTSTIYATVTTASFTAVTTIHVATDSGASLTTSISAVAIGIFSKHSIPQGVSISAAAVMAPGTPKAWVKFNANTVSTGVATILASFNVSSVSITASATMRVNFITPLTDGNVCVIATDYETGTIALPMVVLASLGAASCKVTFEQVLVVAGTYTRQTNLNPTGCIVFYR